MSKPTKVTPIRPSSALQTLDEVRSRLKTMFDKSLGPVLVDLLADPELTELSVNPDGSVWVQTLHSGTERLDETIEPLRAQSILSQVAGQAGGAVHAERPIFEDQIPYLPYRIAGALPPVSPGGTLFSIRKPSPKVWPLKDYFAAIPEGAKRRGGEPRPSVGLYPSLLWALRHHRNVVLSGATSTAKTSLFASVFELLGEMRLSQRYLLLEEKYPEMRVEGPLNLVRLVTSTTARCEAGGPVDLTRLVSLSLRLAPDRIFIGETRGPEALPLLTSWATGHDGGVTTVHASSAEDTLYRLEDLLYQARYRKPRELVARTVSLVVHLEFFEPGHRLATSAVWVDGLDADGYRLTRVEPAQGDPR